MLEPSDSDVTVLFLVLVVLPLVAYFFLGKWIEATKKRDKITLFAYLAAEETLRAADMAVMDVIPTVLSSKGELHECARCSAPARTRCSKCKSVRYCSGNCQIIHWRQIHKQECQQLETHNSVLFPLAVSFDEFRHGSGLFNENSTPQFFSHSLKQTSKDSAKLDDMAHPSTATGALETADYALFSKSRVSTFERRTSNKSNRETQTRNNGSIHESSGYTSSPSSCFDSKEMFKRQKLRINDNSVLEEETSKKVNASGIGVHIYEQHESRSIMYEGDNYQSQNGNAFVPRKNYGSSRLSSLSNNDESVDEFEMGFTTKGGNVMKEADRFFDEAVQYKCSSDMTVKRSLKAKKMARPPKIKCSKSLK